MTVADVLNAAADLIDGGAVQWGFGEDLSRSVVCMGTAMGRVCNADVNRDVIEHLARTLGWTRDKPDVLGFIFNWNDAPGRTQAEVVAALRAAAERAS